MMPVFIEEQARVAFCHTPKGDCILKIIAETCPSTEEFSSYNNGINDVTSDETNLLEHYQRRQP